ncbi:unnamed protein product [Symbiodinium sp. KB8]|nr:unnamed protein product [Symbiodinium sp. KB8]
MAGARALSDEMGENLTKEGEQVRTWCARSRECFDRCQRKTGVNFPEEAKGWLLLHRSGMSEEQRAVVLDRTAGDLKFDTLSTAMRSCFPEYVVPKKRATSHAAHYVEQEFDEDDWWYGAGQEPASAEDEANFQDVELFLPEHDHAQQGDWETYSEAEIAEAGDLKRPENAGRNCRVDLRRRPAASQPRRDSCSTSFAEMHATTPPRSMLDRLRETRRARFLCPALALLCSTQAAARARRGRSSGPSGNAEVNVKFGNGAQETSQRLIEMPAAWLADEGSFERPSSKEIEVSADEAGQYVVPVAELAVDEASMRTATAEDRDDDPTPGWYDLKNLNDSHPFPEQRRNKEVLVRLFMNFAAELVECRLELGGCVSAQIPQHSRAIQTLRWSPLAERLHSVELDLSHFGMVDAQGKPLRYPVQLFVSHANMKVLAKQCPGESQPRVLQRLRDNTQAKRQQKLVHQLSAQPLPKFVKAALRCVKGLFNMPQTTNEPWVAWAGLPHELVTDASQANLSEAFTTPQELAGVTIATTAAEVVPATAAAYEEAATSEEECLADSPHLLETNEQPALSHEARGTFTVKQEEDEPARIKDAQLPVVFQPVPPNELAVMRHSDAAYADGREGATQAGYLVSFTHKAGIYEEIAPPALLWSHRRRAASPAGPPLPFLVGRVEGMPRDVNTMEEWGRTVIRLAATGPMPTWGCPGGDQLRDLAQYLIDQGNLTGFRDLSTFMAERNVEIEKRGNMAWDLNLPV